MQSENTNLVDYLISLSQEGRKRSFIDLCEINLQNIYTVVSRLLLNEELSRRVTTHTFLLAWDKIKEYNPPNSFALWLKNFAIQLAMDELKRADPAKLKTEMKSNAKNDSELLDGLIMSLPLEDRIIFVLHDLEGYSYEEINGYFDEMITDELRTKVITTRENLMNQLNI